MPSRTFTDERGVEWVVLEVTPTWAERRAGPDRRVENRGPTPGRPERRTGGDRRRGLKDTGPRVKISTGLAGGWLAFEGGGERRRLTPIPAGWFDASSAELVRMLERAAVVAVRGRLAE